MRKSILIVCSLILAPLSSFAAQSAEELKPQFLKAYAQQALTQYSKALESARALKTALSEFTKNPTAQTQDAAKDAWNLARADYLPTEAFRFNNGPIDREGGPEGQINSWPLDEVVIDYTIEKPNGGIINSADKQFAALTPDLLINFNQKLNEKSITVGYHAIEFLLWGQDNNPTGPGLRTFKDYLRGQKPNAIRRALYLNIVADILVDDLTSVVREWDPANSKAYVHEFLSPGNVNAHVIAIVDGLSKFLADEMANERMYVALDDGDQEREHSCFSDTTHNDFHYNYAGVLALLNDMKGGPGLVTLIGSVDDDAANKIINTSDKTGKAIDVIVKNVIDNKVPFDQQILREEFAPSINLAVTRLQFLAKLLKDSEEALK